MNIEVCIILKYKEQEYVDFLQPHDIAKFARILKRLV